MKKVLFVSSTGGHLNELLELKRLFKKYDYHIITEKTKTNIQLKEQYKDRINYLVYGTKSHPLTYIFKFTYNFIKGLILFIKIKPDVVVTTGAHTGAILCYIAKICRKKVIYIETFANMHTKTITGRLVYPIADMFIVQWESMKELYPKAIYGGWIF